jgi:hypothetical protein
MTANDLVLDWSIAQAWLLEVDGTLSSTRKKVQINLEHWWPLLSATQYREFSISELAKLFNVKRGSTQTTIDMLKVSEILTVMDTGPCKKKKFKVSAKFAKALGLPLLTKKPKKDKKTPRRKKEPKPVAEVPVQEQVGAFQVSSFADLQETQPTSMEEAREVLDRLQQKTNERLTKAVTVLGEILGVSQDREISERALCAQGELHTVQGYACSIQRLLLFVEHANKE